MADFNPIGGGDVFRSLVAKLEQVAASQRELSIKQTRIEEEIRKGGKPSVQGDERAVQRTLKPGGVLDQAEQATQRQRVTKEVDKQAAAEERLSQIQARSRIPMQGVEQELARDIQLRGLASQGLRKHGALTTEFIGAAARGEVTMRELGFQVGATIAKFSGWTAASVAVFGALDAIRELGKGATASVNGVATLQRFINNLDTSKAQQGFRNVSQQLNVPIEDVVNAQTQFARVFKTQDSSLTAAHTALLATKLDNISLADSYRFLTGITQEWGLQARDLPGIFDQISAAQRRLGARVSEILPALARSGAAVKNTGGDINQLIALLAVAQVRSGQTGNTVGTAFSRAASNFYRKPANAEVLQGFGVNPNLGFTQAVIQAVQRAQALNGADKTKLAAALGGPQYGARIFQSLLNAQPSQIQNAINRTSPGASKGSAQAELKDQLRSVTERLHAMLNAIERMGSALAQSGLFTGFGALLDVMTKALNIANLLVAAFANLHLPPELRTALTALIPLLAVRRGVQRFTPYDQGRTGIGSLFQQSEQTTTARRLRKATGEEVNFFKDEQERVSRQLAVARHQQLVSSNQRVVAVNDFANGKIGQEELERVDRRAIAAENRAADLADEHTAASQGLADAEERNNQVIQRVIKGRENAVKVARELGVTYIPGVTNPPTAQGPAQITKSGIILPSGATRPGGSLSATARAEESVATGLKSKGGEMAKLARSGNLLGAASVGYNSVATKATGALESSTGLLRATSSRLLGFLAGLGPMFAAVALFTGIDLAVQAIHRNSERIQKVKQSLERAPTTLDQARKNLGAAKHESFLDKVGNVFEGVGVLTGHRQRVANEDRAQKLYNDAARRDAAQQGARNSGTPIPYLKQDEIRQRAASDEAAYKNGEITLAQFRKRLKDRFKETATSYAQFFGGDVAKQAQQQTFDQLRATQHLYQTGGSQKTKFGDRFLGLNPDAIVKTLQADFANASSGVPLSNRRVREDVFGYTQLAQQLGRNKDPDSISKLAEARQQLFDGIAGQAKTDLDNALKFAKTKPQRDAAYQAYYSRLNLLKSQPRDQIQRLQKQREAVEKTISELQSQIPQAQQALTTASSGNFGVTAITLAAANLGNLRKSLDANRKKVRQDTAQLKVFNQIVKALDNMVAQAQKEAKQAQIEADKQAADTARQNAVDLIQARGRLATSGIPSTDQVAQLRSQINTAKQVLAKLRSSGAKLPEIINAQADLQQLETDLAQTVSDQAGAVADARFDLRLSQTDDPIKKARIEVQRAKNKLARAKTPQDRIEGQAGLNNAKRDLQQTVADEKIKNIEFDADIEKISTEQEIAAFQKLLRTVKLSRDQKRDLLRRIHDLKKQADQDANAQDLAVGSIRLPTIYEIRRLLKQGTNSAPLTLQQENKYTFNVSSDSQAEIIGGSLDAIHGTHVKSAARSAGLRG